jgi:hypothetical protein
VIFHELASMLLCLAWNHHLKKGCIMRCNIQHLLLCLTQASAMPACAQDAPQRCSASSAQAAAAACSNVDAAARAPYPLHAWFDSLPDQGAGLALAAIMIAMLALRVSMR